MFDLPFLQQQQQHVSWPWWLQQHVWAVWAVWAAAVNGLVPWVLQLFVTTRVYRAEGDSHERALALLDHAGELVKQRRALQLGNSEMHLGRLVPGMVVALWPRAVVISASVARFGIQGAIELSVSVTAPLWSGLLEPELLHAEPDAVGENTIRTLAATSANVHSCYMDTFSEVALDPTAPQAALMRARSAGKLMASAFRAGGGQCRVFLLSGPPGSGKSLATREATRLLGGVLYNSYDPTRAGECVMRLLTHPATSANQPIVVCMEECDVALRRVVRGDVAETDSLRRDAHNKSSWNTLLSNIKVKMNILLILTTNVSDEQLLSDVCQGDTSLLRSGRVDERISFFQQKNKASRNSKRP